MIIPRDVLFNIRKLADKARQLMLKGKIEHECAPQGCQGCLWITECRAEWEAEYPQSEREKVGRVLAVRQIVNEADEEAQKRFTEIWKGK